MECRARFLQLRLKELAGQEEHYKAELEVLRQQQQQLAADEPQAAAQPAESADALAQKQQEPAAAGAPTSAPQLELKQEPAAEEGILSSALPSPRHQSSLAAKQGLLKSTASLGEQPSRPRRSQHKRKLERLHAPDLTHETLLRHPMFAALAGVRNPAKVISLPWPGLFGNHCAACNSCKSLYWASVCSGGRALSPRIQLHCLLRTSPWHAGPGADVHSRVSAGT